MNKKLYILHLEDNVNDAELVCSTLEANGVDCEVTRVDTKTDFISAIEQHSYDLIISAYTLPSFNGLTALKIAHQKSPEIPFIFVSTTIGEDVAIESLLSGATDYVLKQKISRLVPAVMRALGEAGERKERKRAEAALRVSEARFRGLLESAPDPIVIAATRGEIVFVNIQTEKVFGYSRDELFGKSIECLIPERFRAKHKDHMKRFALDPKARPMGTKLDLVALRKDCTEFSVDIMLSPLQMNDEFAVLAVIRNVTEIKRAEEDIRNAEVRYRTLFQQSPDGIVVIDPENLLPIEFNERVHTQLGYSREEFAQLRISDYEVIDEPEEIKARAEKIMREGRTEFETKHRTKNGDIKHVHVTVLAFILHDKPMFYAIYRDITDQKKVTLGLKNLEAQLFQMQKLESIGTLAGGIAHDFNNILGIIMAHSSILKKELGPGKFFQSVESIATATQRGAALVRQLLTFAHKTDVHFESVNVNIVVNEIQKLLSETLSKTIIVATTLQEAIPLVNADSSQLHRILLNLCINARDAMSDNGILSLTTGVVRLESLQPRFPEAKAREYLQIEVADTGTGIDEQTRSRIFEPFFTTKGVGKGTGLGLALVFGLVKSHEGFVDVESELGKGTIFRVFLPIPEQTVESTQSKERMEQEIPGGSETILLIEDEEALKELVKAVLVSKGYKVLTAGDGEEAIHIYSLHQAEIDLVLSDLGLPKFGGMEVFKRLKAIKPKVKVIIASGYIESNAKSEMYKLGVVQFVQKPYMPDELLRRIREVIGG